MRQFDAIAIAGIPGAGKTTLANALRAIFGWEIVSTGDIARRVDPASLEVGGLADESLFRKAFLETYYGTQHDGPVILDGLPRSRGQVALLPEDGMVIALTCRPDIAIARLTMRGRPDDTPDLVVKRVTEQTELLEIERADSWLYAIAGWGRTVNTSQKQPDMIAADVAAYLSGDKRECF